MERFENGQMAKSDLLRRATCGAKAMNIPRDSTADRVTVGRGKIIIGQEDQRASISAPKTLQFHFRRCQFNPPASFDLGNALRSLQSPLSCSSFNESSS